MQRIIDPSGLEPGALPKDDRDLAIRMNGAYVQAFDNVSVIPDTLSDALCRATTGTSFVTRTLYTDRGLTILRYRRPIILNGIETGALNGDLIERSLPLDLQRIPPEKRRPERAAIGDSKETNPGILDMLDRDHPVILGAILDLVSEVLENASLVSPENLPRMADYGKALAALDKSRNWDTLTHYTELVETETGQDLENYPFLVELVEFINVQGKWEGTATALRNELTARLPADERPPAGRPPKGWPADAPRAGALLRRKAPTLRVHGVTAEPSREGKKRDRVWTIQKLPSTPSALSAKDVSAGSSADPADSADSKPTAGETLLSALSAKTSSSCRSDGLADSADSTDSNSRKLSLPTRADSSALPFVAPPHPGATESDGPRRVHCPACRQWFDAALDPGDTAYCANCDIEFTIPRKGSQ